MSTQTLSAKGLTQEEFDQALLSTKNTDIVFRTTKKDMEEMGYGELVASACADENITIYGRQVIIGHELVGFLKEK